LQGKASWFFIQKYKISLQAKRKLKLCKVFEREVSDLIIIQLIEFLHNKQAYL
jgi:hypothetical protein